MKAARLFLVVPLEQKHAFQEAATSRGLSLSAWMRSTCMESIRDQPILRKVSDKALAKARTAQAPLNSSEFDQFWAAYPKRVGKDAARKAWRTKKPALGEVLAGLTGQLDWLARDNWKYCPNPATWLNQGRWQDTPPHVNLFVSERTAKNLAARELAMAQIALREPHTLAPDKESSS